MRLKLLAYAMLALVAASALASLGLWQLRRADAKQALLDGIDRARLASLSSLIDAESAAAGPRFRAVAIDGEFLNQRQVLLDNQLRDGQPGVRAYVPLKLIGDARAVLVDRGWLAWPDRSHPAPVATVASGAQHLEGVLLDPPGAGMQLGAAVPQRWPLLVTRIDLRDIELRLGQPLLDFVLEDRNASRAQSIRAGMLPPERHRGYALQWFGLSLTVLIIYGVLAWRAGRAGPSR